MARDASLNVSLTTPLRNYVRAKVKSGRYDSASEVVRDGLRALQERDRGAEAFWAGVRRKVAIAREQVARGETVDGESAMNDILAELSDDAPIAPKPSKRKRKPVR
jgi:antitoxin ParD1/3/4